MKKLLSIVLLIITWISYGQLTQNFESGTFPPTGWTTFDNGVGTVNWSTTSSAALAYGGTGTSAFLTRVTGTAGVTAEEYLVTQQFLVPANGQLRFYTRTTLAGDDGSTFSVRISTTSQTGTAAFTTIPTATWTENTLNTTFNVYEEKVVSLSTYAGQNVYLAFVRTNENGDRWLIDNINVVEACNAPATLTSTNIGTTFATLGWTGPVGATQWEIEVQPQAVAFTGVPNYTPVTTNPYTVSTGLTQGTAYKFKVRAICPSGFPSEWSSATGTFTTTIPGQACAAPIVVGSLPYTTTNNTSNFGDTNDILQPLTCSGSATNYMQGNDVFYTYTPTVSGNIAITLTPAGANSSIHVYNACPGTPGATCLAGVANTNSNPRNINPFAVTAGTTYYIIVSSSATSQTVGYTLTIQQVFCTQPSALTATNITTTSADLSWGNPSGATSWQVSVGMAPYGLPTGAGTTVNTNTGWTYNGVSGVVYQYYVRADCNDGNFSVWSGPFTFTLPQVATNLNFSDGFETVTGWTLANISSTNVAQPNKWALGTAVANGGTHSIYISDTDGATNNYNITGTSVVHAYKDFNIPAGAIQGELKFDWRSIGENANDYFRVWMVPTTFTPNPGTQITAGAGRIKVGIDFSSSATWVTQVYDALNISSFAGGTMRLVFEWRNNNATGVQTPAAIDNVMLNLIACPKPTAVAANIIGYNYGVLSWTAGNTETQWEVITLPQGSPAPNASSTGINVTTNPYTITGLNSITCYDVYIRAVCGPGNVSYWTGPYNFCTTPHFCAGDHFYDTGGATGAYSNNANSVTTICPDNAGDVVTVIFNSFNIAAGDNLVIRDGNLITSPVLGTYTGTTLPPSFTATSASGCLTFVFTSNATGTAAGWDATIYCTPPITCPKPTNLSVTSVTNNSAQLSWTESGSATQWEVIALPIGSPVPAPGTAGTVANSNPFVLTGLNPGTAYTYFVRAICSASDASYYSNGFNFYTKPNNDDCANAINVPVNNDLNCTVVTPGTITGSTGSGVPASTCGGAADDDVWFSFTATSQAHIINFNNIVGSTTDLSHAVYSGTCGALTLLYCDVNNFSYNNTFVAGQTYYIRVWSATTAINQTASFNVCINKVLPPVFAENSSTVSAPTTYTVQQLVTDVLVTSPCGIVSNITYSTGTNFGQQNGIGYFNKNGSSFGLDEGIILATRSADTCDGPNTAGSEGTSTWPGDAQLLTYMQSVGQSVSNYYNSSKLEFDFVPIADQVKFDFIFASDEYGTFQCDYSDAFAFFLTNTATGVTTNLAVIPGSSPPVPVAVTTIRNNLYNSSCASVNPAFFDKFYGTGNPQNGLPDVVDPINFNGYTVPMSAVGTVIPGQTYHMKFVVGDRNDSSFDSAVFLSKFDIGNVDLGADLTVTGNSALCAGQSYVIDSGLTAPPYEFTWYYRANSTLPFTELVGQTGATLNVTSAGEYKLVAHYIGSSCVGEDTIVVEFYPDLSLNTPEPNDITICTPSPVFDLTQNTPVVLANFPNPTDYIVTYHLTQADAVAGLNAITNPNTYVNTSNPQTIWVRIYSTITFCSGVKSFDIEVVAPPTADISYNSAPYCFSAGVANVTLIGTSGGNYSIIGSPADISVDNSGTVTWTNSVVPGSYTITYNVGSGVCSSSDSFTITIDNPITASFTSLNDTICENGNSVITVNGTPGATVTYSDGTANQTIVLDSSGNASFNHIGGTKTYTLVNVILGSCVQSITGSVTVTVVSNPSFTLVGECQGSSFVISTSVATVTDYTFVWYGPSGENLGTASTIIANAPGTYTCQLTDNSGLHCASSVTQLFDNVLCTIQKGISPNGDGLNDYLKLSAQKVEIFNRYGKEVYSKSSYVNDWHGQSNGGSVLPDGTYYYVIELYGGEVKTGWIYINKED